MSRRARWILRLALAFLALCVLAVLAAFFLFDSIMRLVVIRRVENITGMRATIGMLHLGLRSGAVTIKDFHLYDPPAFGGGICFDMPDLRMVCDANALSGSRLHLTLVRIDVARVVVVEDKKGRSNFGALEAKAPLGSPSSQAEAHGLKFAGIDTLDLSLGTLEIKNLADGRSSQVNFGIHHQILHNVKSEADIAALGLMMALRAGSSTNSGLNLGQLLQGLGRH